MKHLFITILLLLPLCRMLAQEREYVIVVHGGAGAMENLEDDKEKSTLYYAALDSALSIGNAILDAGGEGPEAVMAVVNYFENNPLFNAGKGATCTSTGTFELDASIMEGKDLTAGAVAGLKTVKNPINAAYAVKNKTPHVMLAGEGADRFAKSQGLEIVDNMYFATPKTLKWIEDLKKESKKNGTVGCVVLDKQGNLTAGTSTGGMFIDNSSLYFSADCNEQQSAHYSCQYPYQKQPLRTPHLTSRKRTVNSDRWEYRP